MSCPVLSRRYRLMAGALRRGNNLLVATDPKKMIRPLRAAMKWVPNLNRGMGGTQGCFMYGRRTRHGIRCLEIGGEAQEKKGVVIYIHGGAYVAGSPTLAKAIASALCCHTGMKVICPSYRLAPEHPLPAATADMVGLLTSLVESGTVSPDRLSVVGDSAGGGLTLLTLQRLRDSGRMGILPACAVPISPWTDLTCSKPSHKSNSPHDVMLGELPHDTFQFVSDMAVGNCDGSGVRSAVQVDKADARYSPGNGSFRDLPPLYFQVGGTEVLLDDCISAHDAALAAGVDSTLDIREGMCHSFPIFTPLFPEADDAVRDIAEFILSRTLAVRNTPPRPNLPIMPDAVPTPSVADVKCSPRSL